MSVDPLLRNNVKLLGNPAGEHTIVFVHGFGTDQGAWQAIVEALGEAFRIVLLDNAGSGGADPAAFVQHKYLGLAQYARDVLAVCRALHLSKVTLVGHSVGGMICLQAAVDAPELVSRLVLIGTSPRYLDDGGYVGGFCEADVAGVYERMAENYDAWSETTALAAMMNPGRPELARQFADNLKSIPRERALTVLCSILQADHRALLERVAVPTLIVQTASDYAVPLAVGEYLREHIAGSRLAVIDAEGHLPHISAPDKVLAALLSFLSE